VWVEDAEDDFVDDEENLERGEICLKSLKSFADGIDDDEDSKRFLGAGALVQRADANSMLCDAWMADSILNEGGPNLQLRGAIQILDELFLFHLERTTHSNKTLEEVTEVDPSVRALRTFVLRCGHSVDNEWTCASYMASQARGFVPLKDAVRVRSIYSTQYYNNDLYGMVFDYTKGLPLYKESESPSNTVKRILELLPDVETIKRHTTKRFTLDD
jgi:hypothetical protein